MTDPNCGRCVIGDGPDETEDRRTIHSPQPSHPKNVRVSLRNIEDRMAEMTTESAPSGVFMCEEKRSVIGWRFRI